MPLLSLHFLPRCISPRFHGMERIPNNFHNQGVSEFARDGAAAWPNNLNHGPFVTLPLARVARPVTEAVRRVPGEALGSNIARLPRDVGRSQSQSLARTAGAWAGRE